MTPMMSPSSSAATPSSMAFTTAMTPMSVASSFPSSAASTPAATGTMFGASQRSTITLQQLSSIAMRNVAIPGCSNGDLLDLYFKLVIDGHVVYVSEIVRNTLNPVWMPFEPEALAHLTHDMDGRHHHISIGPLFSGTSFEVIVVRVHNYKLARRKSSALTGVIMADEDAGSANRQYQIAAGVSSDQDEEEEELEEKTEIETTTATTGFYFAAVNPQAKKRGGFDFLDDEDEDSPTELDENAPPSSVEKCRTLVAAASSSYRRKDDRESPKTTTFEEDILCVAFNIRELDPLPIGLTEISTLPLNTCLLEFNGRLYVKREVIELLVEMGVISSKHSRRKGSAIQLKEYSLHDGIDNLERIRTLRKHIEDVTDGNEKLQEQIKERLVQSQTTVTKDHKRAAIEERIQALRRQIAEKKNALDRVKAVMQEERRTFETDIHIPKALLSMMQMSMRYKDEKQGILERRCEVLRAAHKIRARQAMLIKELDTVYRIDFLGAGEKGIRGIKLTNTDLSVNSRMDEENLSTALGYIAHLVFMLSKYLHVNLRYKIVPYSSRSYMKDEINDPHSEYPLYRRGVDRERFERAVTYLKKDIEQLQFARGLDPTHGATLLHRLEMIRDAEVSWLAAEHDAKVGSRAVQPAQR